MTPRAGQLLGRLRAGLKRREPQPKRPEPIQRGWIEADGLVNLRDVGGLPTIGGGRIAPGRLLRSDNLQELSPRDVERLLEIGITDVIDLRSTYESELEGPTPLTGDDRVRVHSHSLFREWRPGIGEQKPEVRPDAVPEQALPWVDMEPAVELSDGVAAVYFSYIADRSDSVLASLRDIAEAKGATLVHCAAGKDRTGTIVALALELVGVLRDEVIADYAASSERVPAIIDRLRRSSTYAEGLKNRPMASHMTRPETMIALLDHIDLRYGGVGALCRRIGWTDADQKRLEAKLLG